LKELPHLTDDGREIALFLRNEQNSNMSEPPRPRTQDAEAGGGEQVSSAEENAEVLRLRALLEDTQAKLVQSESKIAKLSHDLVDANRKVAERDAEITALRAKADEKGQRWELVVKGMDSLSLNSDAESTSDNSEGTPLGSLLSAKPKLHRQQFLPSLLNPKLAEGKSPQQTKSIAYPPLFKYRFSKSSKPGQSVVTRRSPERDKAREEVGVARWETFKDHLNKAEELKIAKKDSSEIVPVWETFLGLRLSKERMAQVTGDFGTNTNEFHVLNEVAATMAFFLSVGSLLLHLFDQLVKRLDVSTKLTGAEPANIALPSLRSHFRPDIYWQLYRPGQLNVLVLMEMKVPWKFPAPCSKDGPVAEAQPPCKDLYTFYMEEEDGRRHASNVLMQIRAYLAVFQRKFGIICGLNCYTFVHLDENQNFYVSDRYWVDKDYEDMSLLERLIRFLLASAHVGDTLDERPAFMQKFLGEQGLDTDAVDPNGPPGKSSSAGGASTSGNAAASSSSSSLSGGQVRAAEGLDSKSIQHHRPFSWLDLEDPRRTDGTFTKHEQTCQPLGVYEGDAKLISIGRVGEVYEKEFDGVRTVSKLLSMITARPKDEGDIGQVYKEMLREVQAYRKLEALQGDVVPRLLNFGFLLRDVIYMVSTEWSGSRIDPKALSPAQRREARDKLRRIHSLGVVHGDINERNILVNPARNDAIVFIDFGFARFRDDDSLLKDEEWTRLCREEFEQLERLLEPTTPPPKNGLTPTTRKRIRSMAPADSEREGQQEVQFDPTAAGKRTCRDESLAE